MPRVPTQLCRGRICVGLMFNSHREGEHRVGVGARDRHDVHVLLPGVHERAHAEVDDGVTAPVLAVDDLRLERVGHVAAGERRAGGGGGRARQRRFPRGDWWED